MNKHVLTVSTGISLCALTALAQPAPPETPEVPPPAVYRTDEPKTLNKISLSYRMGLNITVDFRKLGGFQRIGDPGPSTGDNYDRTYDQGAYNRVDSSGNAGGLTWYWGYENPGAVQGDSLVLQSSTSPADLEVEGKEETIQHGFELAYAREIWRGKRGKLAAELGFSYMPLSISDDSTLDGRVNRILDTYSLDGVVPPVAPYYGTFQGPGPLIDASPSRSSIAIPMGAAVSGERTLESDVFIFRLGPTFEFPIKDRLSGSLHAGLTLAYAVSELRYTERVWIEGVGTQSRSASGEESDLLVGGYAGAALNYEIRKNVAVFAGAYYQFADESEMDSDGNGYTDKEGVLDLGQSIVVNIGISYSF